jgi:hypothetical protein
MSQETLPTVCPDCKTATLSSRDRPRQPAVNARSLALYVLVCESCDHVFQWRSGSSMTQLRRTE